MADAVNELLDGIGVVLALLSGLGAAPPSPAGAALGVPRSPSAATEWRGWMTTRLVLGAQLRARMSHGRGQPWFTDEISAKERILVKREQVTLDGIGVVLTALSGSAARCSLDLAVRRRIDAVVHQVRTEIAQACTAMADQVGEPPLEQQV